MATSQRMLDFKIDVKSWQNQTIKVLKKYGIDVKTFMMEQMGMLVSDLQRRTPARVPGGDTIFSKGKSRSKFKEPAERDMHSLFVRRKQSEVVFLKRRHKTTETISGVPLFWESSTTSHMLDVLKAQSVTRGDSYKVNAHLGKVNFGPIINFERKPHVDKRNFDAAIKILKDKAGKAKAGWNNALLFFGRKRSKQYIARHGISQGSSYTNTKDDYCEVGTTNKVPFISNFVRLFEGALVTRQKYIKRIIPLILRKKFKETNR